MIFVSDNGIVPVYRDEGVVVRTHNLGEADRIVTLVTRRHGKVRAVAKGVRRTASKFGCRLEPFMVADVQFFVGRSLDVVTQAESLASYGALIAADYDRWAAANAMVELLDRLVDAETPEKQYLLLIGALRSLSRGEYPVDVTLSAYLLRALSFAGWAPSLSECARCGSAGEFDRIVVQLGGVVCEGCAPTGTVRCQGETIVLLGALLAGDWDVALALPESSRREAQGVISAYARWHLERGLRSLDHVSTPSNARDTQ